MNEITMKMQADQLIRMVLQENITSEDVSTNTAMREVVKGTVDLIAKEDGIIAGLDIYVRVFEILDDKTEVVEQANFVGSTTGIMNFAQKLDCKEFIIGTENSIVEHLQFACPDKKFYPVSVNLTCMDMKATTLMDIYQCLKGCGGEEIVLPEHVMEGAGRCIRRMVELGG